MASTRRLAAILAADVAGYSRLMGADEEGTLAQLMGHRRGLVEPKVAEHRGRIVKTTGDGMLVEFPSVVDAVRCAIEVQRGMAERNATVPSAERIEFRVGINLGDVIAADEDIFGDGVNVAARLEGLAEPGSVVVSNTVHDQVRDRLPFVFEDLGEQQVKNIARPVRAFRISDAADARPLSVSPAAALLMPGKPSIAVLPFDNMSGDPEQDYFADGMVEEITTALSRLPWLFVIARNSSFAYRGRAVDVKQVARDLGVQYVLEGSVRKVGNRVRITGQLIDTITAAHLWADRFDGVLDNIFDLQDEVASSVVGAIEPKLRRSEIGRASRKQVENLDAYDLFLRALGQFHKYTEQSIGLTITLLKRALAIEPYHAPSAAMIGYCRLLQRRQGWGQVSDAQLADGLDRARQAIEAGQDDPDVLWMGGYVVAVCAGERATAASVIERALALNPNSAYAWSANGWVLSFSGESGRAVDAFQRAMRLSPLDPLGYTFAGGLALAHLAATRYEEAVDWTRRALREQPRYAIAIRMQVVSLAHLGRIDAARQSLKRLLEIQPGLTIAAWKTAYGATFFVPELLDVYVHGLRRAGLPEG
jgi:adenylate cyclase